MIKNNQRIKALLPTKNSRYKSGYISEDLLTKYVFIHEKQPIIYRSSLELKFIKFCEKNVDVIEWTSEPVGLTYYLPAQLKQHTYYPDYGIKMRHKQYNDEIKSILVEVKPYSQTQPPPETASSYTKQQYIKNYYKWKYAQRYCDQHGWVFWIVTDRFLKDIEIGNNKYNYQN